MTHPLKDHPRNFGNHDVGDVVWTKHDNGIMPWRRKATVVDLSYDARWDDFAVHIMREDGTRWTTGPMTLFQGDALSGLEHWEPRPSKARMKKAWDDEYSKAGQRRQMEAWRQDWREHPDKWK